ncbi:MAG: SURF1 family protein [Microthrixaceae bacterium]
MYDFLKRPAWILSHVVIGTLIIACIGLGFWQKARWELHRDEAAQLEARATAAPVALDEVVPPGTPPGDVPEKVRFTRVEVAGTYDGAAEVAVRGRSLDGAPGSWVLTPLVRADGTAVAVVRGWIPLVDPRTPTAPFPGSQPPTGPVTVTGTVQLTQEKGTFGATDPASGTLRELSRVDLARFGRQVGQPLAPVWVQLDGQQPPQPGGIASLPRPVPVDVPSPSQNFSYMMQWWFFALIGLVGYPLILRRVARNRSRNDLVPMEPPPDLHEVPDGDAGRDRPVRHPA